jgi:signal transduction histidine kinase
VVQAVDVWRVQVSDNGIGIQAQEAQALPQRYWRSERARRMRPDGMGLGLSIASEIVGAHGGTLALHPRDPQGTLVCIDLPVYSTDKEEFSDATNLGG